jgi:hypothetical protein
MRGLGFSIIAIAFALILCRDSVTVRAMQTPGKDVLLSARIGRVGGGTGPITDPIVGWKIVLIYTDFCVGCDFPFHALDETEYVATVNSTDPGYPGLVQRLNDGVDGVDVRVTQHIAFRLASGAEWMGGGFGFNESELFDAGRNFNSLRIRVQNFSLTPVWDRPSESLWSYESTLELWGAPSDEGNCRRVALSGDVPLAGKEISFSGSATLSDRLSTVIIGAQMLFPYAGGLADTSNATNNGGRIKRIFGTHTFSLDNENSFQTIDDLTLGQADDSGARRLHGFAAIESGIGQFSISSGVLVVDGLIEKIPTTHYSFVARGTICEGGR